MASLEVGQPELSELAALTSHHSLRVVEMTAKKDEQELHPRQGQAGISVLELVQAESLLE